MILGLISDPGLRGALQNAAPVEEDALVDEPTVLAALHGGFPRLLVHDTPLQQRASRLLLGREIEVLHLTDAMLSGWDAHRKRAQILRRRVDFNTERLRELVRDRPRPTWVDAALRDLSRAAGARLPGALRGFARRVMEFPPRYHDLHALRLATGLSRGALKARFRRREMASPSSYLRWFRVMASAHVLRDWSVTTLHASHRLGYTTDGNFCRAIQATTGLTPTDLRSQSGWDQLVIKFAVEYLDGVALEGWESLDALFEQRGAA